MIVFSGKMVQAMEIQPYAGYWHNFSLKVPINGVNVSTGQATKWSADPYGRVCVSGIAQSYCWGVRMWIADSVQKKLTNIAIYTGNTGRCFELLYDDPIDARGKGVRLTMDSTNDQWSAIDIYGQWSPDMAGS